MGVFEQLFLSPYKVHKYFRLFLCIISKLFFRRYFVPSGVLSSPVFVRYTPERFRQNIFTFLPVMLKFQFEAGEGY